MKARVVYAHKDCNIGKLQSLEELQRIYQSEVQKYINEMIVGKRHHIKLAEMRIFFSESVLSSQLRKCAENQASNLVETWIKGLYYRLKNRIYEKPFNDQQRMELRCIGKYLLTKSGKFGKGNISQEMVDLYWSWIWDKEIVGNPPEIAGDFPMWLSEMCVDFGKAKKAKSLGDWWISVSCLKNGRRVKIPLANNPYLDNPEDFAKSVLIRKRDGNWSFQFTDKKPDIEFTKTNKKIGLDVGLNVLASTSDGQLFGKEIKPVFDSRYKQIQSIRGNRQRQGLKEDSKRLHRLEMRLTGFVKTEIGKVVNKLVKKNPDTTFVIEDLDLRGCKGQKRFAYRLLHKSLKGRAAIEEVNSAYTSQECPSCGYINKLNRRGVRFVCRGCGRIFHADVVGGINLLRRSEDKQITTKLHYRQVGDFLRERYRLRRDSSLKGRKKRLTVSPDAYCKSEVAKRQKQL